MARSFGRSALRASAYDAFSFDAPPEGGPTTPSTPAPSFGGLNLAGQTFDLSPAMPDDFLMRCGCAGCMEALAKLQAKQEWKARNEGAEPSGIPPVGGDSIADDTTTTATLEVQEGQTITSALEYGADQDFFRVGLSAGTKYEFTLEPINFTTPDGPDFKIQILDANGVLIQEVDSGSFGDTETLTFTPTTSGTYYINVLPYTPADFGEYRLTGQISDDPVNPGGESPLDSINWGGNSRRVDTDGVVDANGKQVIHYYFAKVGEVYNSSLGPVVAVNWADFAKSGMRQAFDAYENIINVSYVEVSTAAAADFVLVANVTAPALLGRMSPPGEAQEGQGEFNTAAESWTATSLRPGGFGFITLIHELGHGHGLAHPHDTGGGSTVMRGVTGDLASGYTNGDFGLNSGVYTTMSYQDGWDGGPNGRSSSDDYGYQGTLMAFDIALLQTKYGANTTYANDDNLYILKDVNAAGTMYASIWDTGGTDTIAYNGARDSIIDLRAATLKYEEGGGGRVSYAKGIFGGYTIANGVVIENASGGSGADVLTGNSVANVLTGGAGNDTLDGGAGVDTLNGGLGDDTFILSDTGDVIVEGAGEGYDLVFSTASYTLGANLEGLSLQATGLSGTGNGLNNLIVSRFGNSTMSGLGGDDVYVIFGGGNSITEAAGAGYDILVADGVNGTLAANIELLILRGAGLTGTGTNAGETFLDQGGVNTFIGLGGDDSYVLNTAGDVVVEAAGGGTNDSVFVSFSYTLPTNVESLYLRGSGLTGTGNAGDNVLASEGGNNTLIGGGGNDAYLIANGNDVVVEVAGGGYDVVYARASYALSSANIEALILIGTGLTGFGTAGGDYMRSEGSGNTLSGGDGGDFLLAGLFGDTLTGGGGGDLFAFQSVNGSSAAQRFRISDFSAAGGDVIDLSRVDANSGAAGDQSFVRVGAFSGVAGQLVVQLTDPGVARLSGDVNGDGIADFVLDVTYTGAFGDNLIL